MKLSAVIITKNEEQNIRRCLESLQDVADEIVVVDSFSTDATEQICVEYGVRFVQQQWLGYSQQKNLANNLAANDWIFSIDADEALSSELKNAVMEIKKQNITEDNVFSMNRLTNYCGKWISHCGWYPDKKIRIWNRKVGRGQGEIHETIAFSTKTKVLHLKGDLLHYSFVSPKDFENQMFKFAEMRGHDYYQKGKKYANFYIIVSPIFSFIQRYFFQLGFLDGADGLHICRIAAKATRLKYETLKNLQSNRL